MSDPMPTAELFGYIEWVEFITALIGMIPTLVGLFYSGRVVKDSIENNSDDILVAVKNIIGYIFIFCFFLLYFVLNGVAIQADPTPAQIRPAAQTWIFYTGTAIILVMGVIWVMINEFIYYVIRHRYELKPKKINFGEM